MILGLDYDGCYTADPALWLKFIGMTIANGHIVHVVTMRYESEVKGDCDSADRMDPRLIAAINGQVIPTARQAKRPACAALGIHIDVWIDDNPQAVDQSAFEIWGNHLPEGAPHDPHNLVLVEDEMMEEDEDGDFYS